MSELAADCTSDVDYVLAAANMSAWASVNALVLVLASYAIQMTSPIMPLRHFLFLLPTPPQILQQATR